MTLNEHDFVEAFRYKANSEKTYFTTDIILEIVKDKKTAEAFENLQSTQPEPYRKDGEK